MPALVKSSFTEALLVVLECTDAIIHSKMSGRKSACIAALPCSASTRLPA